MLGAEELSRIMPTRREGTRTRKGRLPREEADRRVAALLDLATTEFMQRGFIATSLNRLSDLSGVSKTTIFRRFGSKEGLFLALADRSLHSLRSELANVPVIIDEVEATLCRFIRAFDSAMRQERGVAFVRLAISERSQSPALAELVMDNTRRVIAPLADFLAQLMQRGVLAPADPLETAFDLISLVNHGFRFLLEDIPPLGEADGDRVIVRHFLRGWA